MSIISEITFGSKSNHYITSKYGWRTLRGKQNWHSGTDYGTNCKNVPIYALEDGYVYSRGYEQNGAGYYIWVAYPRINKRFLYCHLKEQAFHSKGSSVKRGDLLGYTGTTGNSTGIHLHLGVRDLTSGATEDVELLATKYTEPAAPAEKKYGVGRYTINTNALRIRTGPGTNYRQKRFAEFTPNAQKQIKANNHGMPNDCFIKGMTVDILEVNANWGKGYSGWMCLDYCKR